MMIGIPSGWEAIAAKWHYPWKWLIGMFRLWPRFRSIDYGKTAKNPYSIICMPDWRVIE